MQSNRLLSISFVVVLFSMITIIIWASNKGFDLTDEGLYNFAFKFPNQIGAFGKYLVILNQVFGWLHLKIEGLRILRLILTLISSFVFAKGVYCWIKTEIPNISLKSEFLFLLYITIAGLLSYSIYPQTLSYNSLTLINMQFSAGLVFYTLGNDKNKTRNIISLLLAGIIISFQIFTKFTSGFLFVGLFAGLLFVSEINKKNNFKNNLLNIVYLLVGSLLLFVFYAITVQAPIKWFFDLRNAITETYNDGYNNLIKEYTETFFEVFEQGVINFLEVILAMMLLFMVNYRLTFKNKTNIINMLYCFIILYVVFKAISYSWYQSGIGFSRFSFNIYFLWLFIGITPLVILYWKQTIKKTFFKSLNPKLVLAIIILLILPICCSFGTNSIFTINILQYLSPWFVLYFLIGAFVFEKLKSKIIFHVYILVIAIFVFSQTISGLIFHPYRIEGTLLEQTLSLKAIANENIMVNHFTKQHLENVNKIILNKTNFHTGDPIIPLYCSPGLVYLLNANSPGQGWFRPELNNRNCANLAAGKKTTDYTRLILLFEKGKEVPLEFIKCLSNQGVNFPGNYNLIGTIPHYIEKFDIEIYAPVSMIKK